MIEVDYSKCTGCGMCADKCIRNTICFEDRTKPVVYTDRGCVACMHCAIACPSNAITYDGKPAALEAAAYDADQNLVNELEALMKRRRSFRNFTEEKVDTSMIRKALDTSSWAPSTKNQHPTKYLLINSGIIIDQMMGVIMAYIQQTGAYPEIIYNLNNGLNSVFARAQTVVLAYSDGEGLNPQTDAAIALTHVELLLQAQGIGTCWAGYLTRFMNVVPGLRDMLNIPPERVFYAGLLIGHISERYYRIPERIKRADILEIV